MRSILSRRHTRQSAIVLVALATIAAFLVTIVVDTPARATHGTRTLQVSPDVGRAKTSVMDDQVPATPSEIVTITAALSEPYVVQPPQNTTEIKDPIRVLVSGEYVGGPLDTDLGYTPWTPDTACVIEIPQNAANVIVPECTINVASERAGTTLAYFWVDEDGGASPTTVEADATEGRYSGPQDCVEMDPSTTNGTCAAATAKPGAIAEPDITDVVEITFYAAPAELDCQPQVPTDLVDNVTVRPGQTATFDCLVTSAEDEPVPNVVIDGENYASGDVRAWTNVGANDPDHGRPPEEDEAGAATPQTADYQVDDADDTTSGCTTGDDGTCTLSIPALRSQIGTGMICWWIDGIEGALPNAPESDQIDTTFERPNNAANEETDGGNCDLEQVDEKATGEGSLGNAMLKTDLIIVNWEHPLFSKGGIDIQPETQAHQVGDSATLTGRAYDQFGDPMANIEIAWEFFRGSPSHPETINTPEDPDRTCITDASGTCSITFTASSRGNDHVCAWTKQLIGEPKDIRPDPSVVGTNSGGVCGRDQEPPTDATADDGKPSPYFDFIDVAHLSWTTPPPPPPPPPPPEPTAVGYWLTGGDGGVFAFGDARFHGSLGGLTLNRPIVGMAATPSGNGYWLVGSDGGVFAFGDAGFYGSTGAMTLNRPIVGMAPTKSGKGYWLVASDGGIFAFGDAPYHGSTGDLRLNFPIITMAPTPSGNGYWLVASDGGIFAFGKAPYYGSTGDFPLAEPIATIAPTPTGEGYYLVARNGDIFTFGDASYYGSIDSTLVTKPIVGMGVTPTGEGYYLATADGGVFAFGDAPWLGSAGNVPLNGPVLGLAVSIKDLAPKS